MIKKKFITIHIYCITPVQPWATTTWHYFLYIIDTTPDRNLSSAIYDTWLLFDLQMILINIFPGSAYTFYAYFTTENIIPRLMLPVF